MTNVLFDRETLKVVGLNRPALPFEVEIQNVDTKNLTKMVTFEEVTDKVNENGETLYLLPQKPLVESYGEEVQVETIQRTDFPVMVEVEKKVPVLDENNKHVQYEVTETKVTPAVYDEEGTLLSEEIIEQVGTGQYIKCYIMEVETEQKINEDGQPLFYDKEIVLKDEITEVPSLEITALDERYTEGLEIIKVPVLKTKVVSFQEDMNEFMYQDIVEEKQKQLTRNTFFENALLFEEMSENLFSTTLSSFKADLGLDFISLPAGGAVRMEKIVLPKPASIIRIYTETSEEGLEVRVGALASDLQPLDNVNERYFDNPVSEIYVSFQNTTDKRIDLSSIGVLF
jgi:hypothetical protein